MFISESFVFNLILDNKLIVFLNFKSIVDFNILYVLYILFFNLYLYLFNNIFLNFFFFEIIFKIIFFN